MSILLDQNDDIKSKQNVKHKTKGSSYQGFWIKPAKMNSKSPIQGKRGSD